MTPRQGGKRGRRGGELVTEAAVPGGGLSQRPRATPRARAPALSPRRFQPAGPAGPPLPPAAAAGGRRRGAASRLPGGRRAPRGRAPLTPGRASDGGALMPGAPGRRGGWGGSCQDSPRAKGQGSGRVGQPRCPRLILRPPRSASDPSWTLWELGESGNKAAFIRSSGKGRLLFLITTRGDSPGFPTHPREVASICHPFQVHSFEIMSLYFQML